jgi:hypothetical protein
VQRNAKREVAIAVLRLNFKSARQWSPRVESCLLSVISGARESEYASKGKKRTLGFAVIVQRLDPTRAARLRRLTIA